MSALEHSWACTDASLSLARFQSCSSLSTNTATRTIRAAVTSAVQNPMHSPAFAPVSLMETYPHRFEAAPQAVHFFCPARQQIATVVLWLCTVVSWSESRVLPSGPPPRYNAQSLCNGAMAHTLPTPTHPQTCSSISARSGDQRTCSCLVHSAQSASRIRGRGRSEFA